MVVRGVAAAKPVKERLEAFRHVGPVDSTDPYNTIRLCEFLINLRKIIPDHAGSFLVAGTPTISTGPAVFYVPAVQMNLFDLRIGFM